MKLFEVSNGCAGESHRYVLCVADSKEAAIDMAWDKFKAMCYYEDITAKLLCADISYGFCTDVYYTE